MAEIKIFGTAPSGECRLRSGAYIIPVSNGRCAVIRTVKGYFLLGGGIDEGETDLECIRRECMEEVGHSASPDLFLGTGLTYFSEKKGTRPDGLEQRYYLGALSACAQSPSESGNELVWLSPDFAEKNMHHETQRWAVSLAARYI